MKMRCNSTLFFLFVFLVYSSVGMGKPPPKIYDCFLFFNEWEILELRLHELYPVVDKFVLVEACESFRGIPKPFFFEQKKAMFEKYADKIIHIKIEDHFETDDAWQRESYQRNQIMRGLTECNNNDVIMISDVDEFIERTGVPAHVQILFTKFAPYTVCRHWFYAYFLNRRHPTEPLWLGMGFTTYRHLRKVLPQGFRCEVRGPIRTIVFEGGWHFTNMGGFERCLEKWTNWSHWRDYHPTNYRDWRWQVDECQLLKIDHTYPILVKENLDYVIKMGLIDLPLKD